MCLILNRGRSHVVAAIGGAQLPLSMDETVEFPLEVRRRDETRRFAGRVEPRLASKYGVEDPHFAITQLAQTTMRSEIGKLTLDETFLERDRLNALIVQAINNASADWNKN